MRYVVAHCRKVQSAVGLRNVAAHNCREDVYDDHGKVLGELPEYICHPERAAMNEGERCGGLAVLARRTDRIQEADLLRKPQRNAAAAVEVSISASPEWFDDHKPEEWKAYLKDCRKFLEDRYGKDNLLHWATHYDEKSPHMHVLFTPIVQTKKGPKYTSSEFLGGRSGLRELQDEIAAKVGKKYGLERGVEGSKARHTDQYEWAAEITNERAALIAEKKELEKRKAVLEKAASMRLPAFTFTPEKKKLVSSLLTYTLSDGKEVNGWEAYAVAETRLQATIYAKKVTEIAQGIQMKAAESEAIAKELPWARARIVEIEKKLEAFERLTPAQLRDMADKREAARDRQRERQNEQDRGRGGR